MTGGLWMPVERPWPRCHFRFRPLAEGHLMDVLRLHEGFTDIPWFEDVSVSNVELHALERRCSNINKSKRHQTAIN